ncbi:hypothetical protein Syun_013889 [Stephania yunnanensis]|uniref:Uncharacterized protein n=1 Tax=Stephania yunnanensis TaxID=152371 RepID=A0AAP0P926_9MAGN
MSMPRHRPVTATSPNRLNKLSATAACRHRELLDRVVLGRSYKIDGSNSLAYTLQDHSHETHIPLYIQEAAGTSGFSSLLLAVPPYELPALSKGYLFPSDYKLVRPPSVALSVGDWFFDRVGVKKLHEGTSRRHIYGQVKIHDVLAIPAQMQPSISSTPLVGEVKVWWRTTEVSMGNNSYLKSIKFRTIGQRTKDSIAVHGSVYTRDEVCLGCGRHGH